MDKDIKEKIDELRSDVSEIKGALETLNQIMDNLNLRLNQIENNGIKTSVRELKGSFANQQIKINRLKTRLGRIETNVG